MDMTRAAARSARLGLPVREIVNRSSDALATPHRFRSRRRARVSLRVRLPKPRFSVAKVSSSSESSSSSSSASPSSSSPWLSSSLSDVDGILGSSKSSSSPLSSVSRPSTSSSSYESSTTNRAVAAAATTSRNETSAFPPCGLCGETKPYRRNNSSSPNAPYVLNTCSPFFTSLTITIFNTWACSSYSRRTHARLGSTWLSMSQNGTMA
mmetsp:Transcript_1827/g.6900  ORF Transcript_1827/g.6900 Transcript_1827/m.6900 type:complete len:209 (-) Transcript_1827:932-1558(-)